MVNHTFILILFTLPKQVRMIDSVVFCTLSRNTGKIRSDMICFLLCDVLNLNSEQNLVFSMTSDAPFLNKHWTPYKILPKKLPKRSLKRINFLYYGDAVQQTWPSHSVVISLLDVIFMPSEHLVMNVQDWILLFFQYLILSLLLLLQIFPQHSAVHNLSFQFFGLQRRVNKWIKEWI